MSPARMPAHPRDGGVSRVRNLNFGQPQKAWHEYKHEYRRIDGVRAHRYIVEQRIGMILPDKAVVHHVDPNDTLTNQGHFVVCEDQKYHALIERRTRAYNECGNASWVKCRKCLKWDDPANMQSKHIAGEFVKYWHFRYKGRCVNRGERAEIRRQAPRPAPFYRGGEVSGQEIRRLGRDAAEKLALERKAAFQAFLASDSPTVTSGDQDVCRCGERRAKRHGIRHYCVGCGRQKAAGFIRRNKHAALTVDSLGRQIA